MAAANTKRTTSAAKMAAETTKIEPPANAPTLVPMASLRRRDRARFFNAIKNMPVNDEGEIDIDLSTGSLANAGVMYEMVADIEDALAVLAIDESAFVTWAKSASDEDVMQLFLYVFSEMQPGEADSSQS